MANLVAGGLKSLGQHMGLSGAENKVIITEYARTQNLRLTTHPKDPVILSDDISQTAEINEAPLIPEAHNTKRKVRHLLRTPNIRVFRLLVDYRLLVGLH